MGRKSNKKQEPKAEVVQEVETPKAEVVKSASISKKKDVDRSSFSLMEVTLLKDHGEYKKGDVLKRHPNTAEMLIERKIAK